MNFQKITQLLKSHRTVILIAADNAPLIINFLFKSFKQNDDGLKSDAIAEKDLITTLTDYLYALNRDEIQFPKPAKQYLTDWANAGFLRKYPGRNDEFLYEITASTENAFKWIDSLDKREFVGQESRLKNLFESLKVLSSKSRRDSAGRLRELEEKRKQIEQEIDDVKQGKMDVLDNRQIEEQYFLIEEMAKGLLSDFIALLKGIVYSHNEEVWNDLLRPENENDVKRYFADINLQLIVDKAEGYAIFTYHCYACSYVSI